MLRDQSNYDPQLQRRVCAADAKEALGNILQYVDIIICNKEEAIAFSDTNDWKTKNIFEIGSRLQQMPKENTRPRLVMITDAVCPVLVFQDNDRVLEYPVPPVKQGEIFDTNGCGDAFVGGFLAMYVQRMPGLLHPNGDFRIPAGPTRGRCSDR